MKLVTIQLNQFTQKLQLLIKNPSPTGKFALMRFIGALNFYTKFIEKLHINLKCFTIFYMNTLHGNGQMNMNAFFKN